MSRTSTRSVYRLRLRELLVNLPRTRKRQTFLTGHCGVFNLCVVKRNSVNAQIALDHPIAYDEPTMTETTTTTQPGTAVAGNGAEPQAGNGKTDGLLKRPTIEIRKLNRFFGKLKAVNNISISAYAGQVMGFIGPNGAGKTTTMRILATLDMPTSGDAYVCGYSVVDDPDKVRSIVGFMPDAFGKYANMNVVEYLDFYARAYGFRGAARRDAVERVLVFTELRKLADKAIDVLSKGMTQRLGLGRTLIHDPEVLILDEPAAGLDPRARIEVRELIRLLAVQLNKTVLISSHILTELGEICDSAAIIEAGKILAFGSIDEIRRKLRQQSDGSDAGTYIVRVKEGIDTVERWLAEQPHISAVNSVGETITFGFHGDDTAQHELLKQLLANEFRVLEFHQKSESLEDAFMAITKGITQ